MPGKKERTHGQIVGTAARMLRQRGCAGVGVVEVMKACGLTHGGFYAHFPSRTELLAEAASEAGGEGIASLAGVAEDAAAGHRLAALIDSYLSKAHQLHPEAGCPLAAAGSELARQEAPVRDAASARLLELLELLDRTRQADGGGPPAELLLSAMVGALMLSRVASDDALAHRIRTSVRESLKATR